MLVCVVFTGEKSVRGSRAVALCVHQVVYALMSEASLLWCKQRQAHRYCFTTCTSEKVLFNLVFST